MTTMLDDKVADLWRANAELQRRLDEALAERDTVEAQKAAMAEVLEVINSSPGDLAPVFDAIVDKAMRLCHAAFGILTASEGESFRNVAWRGVPAELADFLREPMTPGSGMLGMMLRGEVLIHITDITAEEVYRTGSPRRRALAELGEARTALAVALRKDDALLGLIMIYRQEVQPFSDNQIALLQNFAAQAVIAIENARLITETREALEQQTATAEVLQVINSSPGDLTPVFEAIVEKAHTLCEAASGSLQLWDGEKFRGVAMRGLSEDMVERLRLGYSPSDMPCQRILEGERIVHCPDLAEIDSRTARSGVELGGVRTVLYVALRKEDVLLGQIVAVRREVRPFSEKEIALVESFAAQAVIAMENARLLSETREALEQQTATAEVLQVINSSPSDLAPVFDTMLEKAVRLCEGVNGILWTFDGERARLVGSHGTSPEIVELLRQQGELSQHPLLRRVIQGEHLFQFNLAEHQAYRSGEVAAADASVAAGVRTVIWIALVKDRTAVGAFAISRLEVRPFSDRETALLRNFAAQAVIAMENARLISETREALEQQTATAEVLQVINASPGDLAPVFAAILEKAHRLCDAPCGSLQVYDGGQLRAVATRGLPEVFAGMLRRGVRGKVRPDVVQFDYAERAAQVPDDLRARTAVEVAKLRTTLMVPLLNKDDVVLGRIAAGRQEVRPFTDKQIGLLQNFAAQAVIAMENARLINETREALEQQTATAEVLQVINSSPGDLAPVFDAMLEKALSLCKAAFGCLFTYDGEAFHIAAQRGMSAALVDYLREPIRPRTTGYSQTHGSLQQLIRGESVVHHADLKASDAYRNGLRFIRALVDFDDGRTALWVALRKDDKLLGVFVIYRREVRPFSDKQIVLLQNFAA